MKVSNTKMTGIRKSDFYKRAARRIALQKVTLAKIAAAQRHAPAGQRRKRDTDTAQLRKILKSAQSLLAELATARNAGWHGVKDELDERLDHFDALVSSAGQEPHDMGPLPSALATTTRRNQKTLRNIS